MDPAKLWKRAYQAVVPGPVGEEARSKMNQLANERVTGPFVEVDEANWAIRSEVWEFDQLCQPERMHTQAKPRRLDGPLVVIEFRGRSLLADGGNRVNWWRANGPDGPREVLIITHKGSA